MKNQEGESKNELGSGHSGMQYVSLDAFFWTALKYRITKFCLLFFESTFPSRPFKEFCVKLRMTLNP